MKKSSLVTAGVLASLCLGVLPGLPAQAATSSGWSTSIPKLSDGTYSCTGTRTDQIGMLSIQDCTRAVSGGYWQVVTILRNNSTHDVDITGLDIDAVKGGSTMSTGSVSCSGTIRNKTQVACWGATRRDPGAWVQSYDHGGDIIGQYSGTFDGAIYFVNIDPSYSPTRKVPQ